MARYILSEAIYDEMCGLLTQFENATDDYTEEGYLSDGEWLDLFYEMCVRIQKDVGY